MGWPYSFFDLGKPNEELIKKWTLMIRYLNF